MSNRLTRRDKLKLAALFAAVTIPMCCAVIGKLTDTRWMLVGGVAGFGAFCALAVILGAIEKVREVRDWWDNRNPPDSLMHLAIIPLMILSFAAFVGLHVCAREVWGDQVASVVVLSLLAFVGVMALLGGRWLDRMWVEAWSDWCHGRRGRSLLKYSVQLITGGVLIVRVLLGQISINRSG